MRDELPGVVGEVLNARRDDRASMNANHLARFAEIVEIASDRLQGDIEMSGKILDRNPPRLAQQGDDLRIASCLLAKPELTCDDPRAVQTLRLNAMEMRRASPRYGRT